jgi:hypothetical protein
MSKTASSKRSSYRRPSVKSKTPKRRTKKTTIQWAQGVLSVRWLPEPNLVFANGRTATDPKEGLSLYGPYSLSTGEHREKIRVGFIGTETTIAQAQGWLKQCSQLIPGVKDKRRQYPDFPGFNLDEAFQSEFVFNSDWDSPITARQMASVLTTADKVVAFEEAVDLFASKVALISDLETTDVIICALPAEIESSYSSIGPEEVRASSSAHISPVARAIRRLIRQAEAKGQMSFLAQLMPDEASTTPGLLSRNFRRALKAKTNHAKCPVQIMRQRSLLPSDPTAQDPASRAWNIVTGLYFKSRGRPWQVEGLDPDTCYIGISFYHHITEESHTVHSSVAQLFTTQGESLILRGEEFEWNPDVQGRSPHLNQEYAANLIKYIMQKYWDYRGQYPRRVVIHKTSRYYDEERKGFEDGLSEINIAQYDLVSLDSSGVRFFRQGDYPPVRGTWAQIGSTSHWLYTAGYLPTQGTYPRPHVPRPLEITDKYGDSTYETILTEILALSKMNWNSADYSSVYPITMLFARKVGEILAYLPYTDKSTPNVRIEPNSSFRFYC